MEYIVTTDKNELDLIEGGYYEIYPGIFNKYSGMKILYILVMH